MPKGIPQVRLYVCPLVLQRPFVREQFLHLRVPVESVYGRREGSDIASMHVVIHKEANRCGKERLRARCESKQRL